MKYSALRVCVSVCLACVLCACLPETHVGLDFGYGFAALKPGEWDGDWLIKGPFFEKVLTLTVTDSTSGQIRLAVSLRADNKEEAGWPTILTLRTSTEDKEGDNTLFFATFMEKGADPSKLYLVLLRRGENKDAIDMWLLNNHALAEAIKCGKLKGRITKTDKDGPHCHLESAPINYKAILQPQFRYEHLMYKWKKL